MTTTGLPVEVMLAPDSEADISAFKCLPLDLPEQAHIFADADYLDDHEQALLEESAGLHLVAARRSNCKEQLLPWVSYISCPGSATSASMSASGSRPSSARSCRPLVVPSMQ